NFETSTYGKWILAGEHAVLRGCPALVFPLLTHKLLLRYTVGSESLQASYAGPSGQTMRWLFWSVLERGLELLSLSLNAISGTFYLESNIPLGVGMGASAALCVAVARWFSAQDLLATEKIYSFAKQLEHLFHGKSSGLDIAGVSATQGVIFQQDTVEPIAQTWKPCWGLSSCGQLGVTSHAIEQVSALWKRDAALGACIDQQMRDSVSLAQQSLARDNALQDLVHSVRNAADCFQAWGLLSPPLQQHIQYLYEAGALAVKPTGSGGGGYVLSIWEQPMPELDILWIH
ncbi:MAG: mevalonate kinase, partial [Legionellaceae bacterium]|nr:mevalonate kinase [Legionellaceae bacterium]